MKKLLILTVEWPYGKGETFFENEVNYASGFDEIHCMPFYKIGDKRTVPPHVCIDAYADGQKTCVKNVVGGVFRRHFIAELRQLATTKRMSIKRIKSLLQYSAMVNRRLNMLKKWVAEHITSDDELTIYTYWMASDAVAVSLLRERVCINYHITRCHGFDLYEYVHPDEYIPYRSLTFDNVDFIYPVSANGMAYLKKQYTTKVDHKIAVARLGTKDWGENAEGDRDAIYQIVSCSNLIPVKRVGLLIDALNQLQFKVKWDHFGDGILRDELERHASSLPDNIEYNFHGRIQNDELMKWYQKNHVDLFINVSESEGIPVSIMEALSFGIPVLATDVGGTGEIVHDGENGFLMDQKATPCQIAECISKIASSTETQINGLRRNARFMWRQEYNAATNYSIFYQHHCKRKGQE